jgi:hypothetical protein
MMRPPFKSDRQGLNRGSTESAGSVVPDQLVAHMIQASTRANFFGGLLDTIAERGRRLIRGSERFESTLRLKQERPDLEQLAMALLSVRGEASGVVLAERLLEVYANADENKRLAFLKLLGTNFGVDEAVLCACNIEISKLRYRSYCCRTASCCRAEASRAN